jgi:hypothetical protein
MCRVAEAMSLEGQLSPDPVDKLRGAIKDNQERKEVTLHVSYFGRVVPTYLCQKLKSWYRDHASIDVILTESRSIRKICRIHGVFVFLDMDMARKMFL